jgi:hypothetical protein
MVREGIATVKRSNDGFDRLEELVIERPGLTVVLLIAVIGLCWLAPWAVDASRARVAAQTAKSGADDRALRAHLEWLRAMSDSEKARWPVVEVCRPGLTEHGTCRCRHWDDSVVSFAEVLPSGDMVCRQTR